MKTLFVMSGFALLTSLGCSWGNEAPANTSSRPMPQNSSSSFDLHGPLSISLDNEGDFAEGSGWKLDVTSDLSANLEIRTFPEVTSRTFKLSDEQIAKLRALLAKERFFELDDEYGQSVLDSSTQTITVQCGSARKTVRLRFLMNWVHNNPNKLVEPSRAIRVWMHVRKWFDDEDAVNLSRYDQMIVDAVAKL